MKKVLIATDKPGVFKLVKVPESEKRNHRVTLRLSEYEYDVISELVPDGSSVGRYLRELVVKQTHLVLRYGVGIISSNCIECEQEEEAREKVVHLNMTATEFKEFEEICDTYKKAKGFMARLFIFGRY